MHGFFNVWAKWKRVGATDDKWLGRCGDSFCYNSCDITHCRADLQLAATPKLHNEEIKLLHKKRADALCKFYDLVPGSELADDVQDIFRRLMEVSS